ncbi:hypothetical protein DYB26_003966 [Aphanomyces astaci]|uniref:Uncharacterized protein n=1 Tax=Aphanomyces astaci TaxID=112090 RepID=A0A397EX43_APHAT|nr:hypothetical protein DYB31_009064 [Aphanomyces astaci]RHZ40614.1 hypothetical protein DYB26_003966 [Aphanomyces astaci]
MQVPPGGSGRKNSSTSSTLSGYRVSSTALPSVMPLVPALDTLFRKTARRVLKLPHDHPTEWFFDPTDGLGLVHCERFSHNQRHYHFLRIANDRGSPTHDLLMESLEAYQLDSGLTDHPPAFRIPPLAADATLLGTILRDLAIFKPALTITTLWHQPADSLSLRPNDHPIWAYHTPALGTTLISINRLHAKKVRWVGDITNDKGTMLLSLASNLRTEFGWTSLTLQRILAGLHQSGDAALQICDNTKSIGLVVLTRSLKHRGGLPRYSNIHRVELRSLMALFTDTRTFTGD